MPEDQPIQPASEDLGTDDFPIKALLNQLAEVKPTDEAIRRAMDLARDAIPAGDEHEYAIHSAALVNELPRNQSMLRLAVATMLTAAIGIAVIGIAVYALNSGDSSESLESNTGRDEIIAVPNVDHRNALDGENDDRDDTPRNNAIPNSTQLPSLDGSDVGENGKPSVEEPPGSSDEEHPDSTGNDSSPNPKAVANSDLPPEEGNGDLPRDGVAEANQNDNAQQPDDIPDPATLPLIGDDGPEWGKLVGVVKFLGTPPKPQAVNNPKLANVCGNNQVVKEGLLVNPQNRGLRNVVIWLRRQSGVELPVHPAFERTKDANVLIDNKGCRFAPHIALLRTTQQLVVSNNDPFGHNFKIDCLVNQPANVILPPGKQVTFLYGMDERLPTSIGCNIHPWMNGYVLIKDHPYMALSDENGRFEIDHLPIGQWTFQFWHETAGYLSEVELNGEKTKWARGRVDVLIGGETEDLGSIEVPAASFEN